MIGFETEIARFLASFARTAAWAHAAPFLGDSTLSPKLRVGVAAAIAFSIAWLRPALELSELPLVLPGELFLGFAAGFVARVVIAGVEAGGQLIGMELGIGFASSVDPSSGEDSLPTRRIALALAAIAFFQAGGVRSAIVVLAASPLGGTTPAELWATLVASTGRVFIAAIRLAAPLLVAGVTMNLAVAVASRAAPALNAFSVMLAFFALAGGVFLYTTAPAFSGELHLAASGAIRAVEGLSP